MAGIAERQELSERILGFMNGGAMCLMISIGYQTGLFDTMVALGSATVDEIARKSGRAERYVREWLGALVTGGIVDFDPATRCYQLPEAHVPFLTAGGDAPNLAVITQWIAELGRVESDIIDRFANGGGVHYDQFHRFHEIMADQSGQTTVGVLTERILPLAPNTIDRLQAGIDVLDIGCGRGLALLRMAREFPNSRFVGYDLCEDTIRFANERARTLGLSNLRFEQRDVAVMDTADTFDLITGFDVIHDQRDPSAVLRNVRTALKPDGVFLMQDIAASSHVEQNMDHPLGPFVYTISTMHCMTVSLAQGGAGLGTAWGRETAERMIAEAGFDRLEVKEAEGDFLHYYYICS